AGRPSPLLGAVSRAGTLAGLLIDAAQMAPVHVYSKIYHYPVYPRATLKDCLISGWQSIPALFTPFIVVGGILLGWFTATESAAAAVLYAAGLSLLFYREMDRHQLWTALLETGKLSAVALFCVGTASVFGFLLAYYQIPKVRLRYALKDTMIMLVPMLVVLAAMIVWPEIPLLLPRLIRPEFLK